MSKTNHTGPGRPGTGAATPSEFGWHQRRYYALFCSLAILLCLLFTPPAPTFAAGKNFLWRVKSQKSTVYLLGSIHLMKKESYPLAQAIEEAFSRSGTLVVEANLNDIGQTDAIQLLGGMFYTGGETIKQHLSEETYRMLRKEAEGLGLPVEAVQYQRPWIAGMMLTSLELMKAGYEPAYGIDMHFLGRAGAKKVEQLESVAFQMSLFSRLSDAEQEAFLRRTLKELRSMRTEADAMVRAWKEGDAAAMERIISRGLDDPRMAALYARLLDERNVGMTAKIEGYLSSGGTYFVVMGAGHLVGSRGVVSLLRQRGYSPEQL